MIRVTTTATAFLIASLVAAGATATETPTPAPQPDAADLAVPALAQAPAIDDVLVIHEQAPANPALVATAPEAPAPPPPASPAVVQAPEPVAIATPVLVLDQDAAAKTEAAEAARKIVRLTPAERSFAEEESNLLRDIRLLDLNIELTERRQKLAALKNPTAAVAPSTATTTVAVAPQISPVAPAAPVSAPAKAGGKSHPFQLVSIWGSPEALRAEFVTGSARRTVTPGQSIAGGWTLDAVRPGEVVVRSGTRSDTVKLEP